MSLKDTTEFTEYFSVSHYSLICCKKNGVKDVTWTWRLRAETASSNLVSKDQHSFKGKEMMLSIYKVLYLNRSILYGGRNGLC